jgi:hypothetical protein
MGVSAQNGMFLLFTKRIASNNNGNKFQTNCIQENGTALPETKVLYIVVDGDEYSTGRSFLQHGVGVPSPLQHRENWKISRRFQASRHLVSSTVYLFVYWMDVDGNLSSGSTPWHDERNKTSVQMRLK